MYDTNSTQGQPIFAPRNTHIPFEASLRIVADESKGRRMVTQRSGQLLANMIETDLTAAGWNIATPLPYVPAFGSTTARIVIRGFFERNVGGTDTSDDVAVFRPTQPIKRIAAGTVPGEKTSVLEGDGGGGNLSYGQNPVAQMDILFVDLISDLQASSSLIGTSAIVEKVDLMGVKYGKGGRSFPQ